MEPVPRVLIADDERTLREALVRFFRSLEMSAEGVATAEDALRALGQHGFDLLVCDMQLAAPGSGAALDGLALLAEVRRRRPGLPVIILTGHASIATAVDAMRAGAAN